MALDPRIPLGVQMPQSQSPLEMLSQFAQLQDIRERTEARRLAGEEARTKHLRQQQIDEAYRDAITVDDNGELSIDYGRLTQHLPGDLIPGVVKELRTDKASALGIQKAQMELDKLRQDHLGSAARTVIAAKGDPNIWGLELRGAKGLGAIDDDAFDRLSAIQDPQQILALANCYLERAGMQPKLEKIETVDAQGQPVTQFVTPQAGATYAQAPKAETDFTLSPGSTRFGPSGKVIASVPAAPRHEELKQVIGPNGLPIWVRESQAVGRQAGGGGAAGGRPVTSGDANRIADMDTGRNDLAALSGVLTQAGATGTLSKVGASMPNWVTDLTGWGEDAKKKQALIDRVKQVIGKTLEGGVLRKEDEVKYEKILPTIGDPAGVVRAKLQGLDTAIAQRRSTQLDALADAGYDVSRFSARPTRPLIDSTAGGQGVSVKAPDGHTYTFKTAAEAEAFKRRAGIR